MNITSKLAAGTAALSFFLISAVGTFAADYTLTPWIYDPGNTGEAVATLTSNGVHLEKNGPTSDNVSAGVTINGVSSLSTTGMTLSYQVQGYCGAGAPRFNVNLSNGQTIFLACIYGNDGSGNVSFTAGQTYGGVLFPEGQTVQSIDIVQDEQGQTTLSNITVNGTPVTVTTQALKDQCKNGGWMSMTNPTFKNQGQCVSYFEHQSHS